ncbi:peptide ABC transporter ATP-binding protein [Lactococcus hodotermopsidis]|uniref:Peptide ABC transporter ATP-binding protein n=1 Tax=Pseudolactococcus hodotermopsidis TaxID=2709157 RepID=A0A6A0BGY3_9LACT|nr:ATP-binding cassette domain-containing protein [Lactococcus hodotermopsidis]GFH43047.1 peptide ABC transporter ATP-binding protein [Lactococcus hodotermopsidis]
MIELQNVSKKFGKNNIFENVNLVFETGKSYALVGASGSGKTTLLNGIARLEKMTSGQILLNGKNIWESREKSYFKNELGYVFQNYALVEDETVSSNLKMIEKDVVKQKQALEKVGLLDEHLTSKIYELSGGQAQRVAIARLVLKQSRIILADEPTGALDKDIGVEIRDLLLSLLTPESVVIFATHDATIYDHVDEVIALDDLK